MRPPRTPAPQLAKEMTAVPCSRESKMGNEQIPIDSAGTQSPGFFSTSK